MKQAQFNIKRIKLAIAEKDSDNMILVYEELTESYLDGNKNDFRDTILRWNKLHILDYLRWLYYNQNDYDGMDTYCKVLNSLALDDYVRDIKGV